jgi:hypothetical protein
VRTKELRWSCRVFVAKGSGLFKRSSEVFDPTHSAHGHGGTHRPSFFDSNLVSGGSAVYMAIPARLGVSREGIVNAFNGHTEAVVRHAGHALAFPDDRMVFVSLDLPAFAHPSLWWFNDPTCIHTGIAVSKGHIHCRILPRFMGRRVFGCSL